MSYIGNIPSFGQIQDPYDLSMCFPQYLEEAQEIVAEIRGHVNTIRAWDPTAAKALDDELVNLIAMHRNSNACLNVSMTDMGFLYQTETQALLDKARRLAASPPAQASPAANTAWSQSVAAQSPTSPVSPSTSIQMPGVQASSSLVDLGPVIDTGLDPAYIDQEADDSMLLFGIAGLVVVGAIGTGLILWLRK